MTAAGEHVSGTRLALLGRPALLTDGRAAALAIPARAHTLLALLAMRYDRPALRGHLAASLWPEVADEEARANLRRHLHLIVRALPTDADALLLTKSIVQWNPDARITCDVVEFLRAARTPATAAGAVALYAGELCAGVADETLEPLRAEIAAQHEGILRTLVDSAVTTGDTASAVLALHRLVDRDPLDESSARALILARFASGDRAGALRDYHALVARLRTELDLDPEPQTAALFDRILHAEGGRTTAHNLVTPTSALVGRALELRTVVEALQCDRLVTLVGSPGIGKTRLAIEAGFVVLDRFPDGVHFVDLARDETAPAAFERIARVLDPSSRDDAIETSVAAIAGKSALLILDNLEQLGDEAAHVIDTLTSRTGAHVLATSRRRVRAEAERVVTLGALQLPPLTPTAPGTLATYPAVRLFLERATRAAPDARLTFDNARSVTTIVRRLDGIPLAIELVASRANLLTIDGIAKRLDEQAIFADPRREERHGTIDGAIAWSYELLSPVEKAVFRRIAVFADSCTMEALEDVCETVTAQSIGPISELVESSLLTAAPAGDAIRYRTFELTRAFAGKELRAHGEYDEAVRRHAEHYARRIEQLSDEFTTEREQDAYERCAREHGNFEIALGWSVEHDASLAARFIGGLWRYWIFRGRVDAGEAFIQRLERGAGIQGLPALQHARLLQAAGMLAREADLARARPYLEQALTLFRLCGDARGESESLTAVAAVHFSSGNFAEAERGFAQCLALHEARGDRRAAAGTRANLAQLAWLREDCEEALAILELALDGFRATNNARGIAHVFRTRASIFGTLGRMDDAIAQAEQSVALYEALGETARVGECWSELCTQYTWAGRIGDAFAAICRSLEILVDTRHGWHHLCNSMRSLHFAAHRAEEHQDVLRIDVYLHSLANRFGQAPLNHDGTTEHAAAAARSALPSAVVDATVAAAHGMEARHLHAIAKRLHERHAALRIEPFDQRSIGRSSDA